MNTLTAFVIALAFVSAVVELSRRKHLREKFAVLWLVIGVATIVLAGFPQLLEFASRLVGVQVPANLLFALSILLLMGVCLHLSLVLTKIEDQTRVLAEEVALLRFQVEAATPSPDHGADLVPPRADPDVAGQKGEI